MTANTQNRSVKKQSSNNSAPSINSAVKPLQKNSQSNAACHDKKLVRDDLGNWVVKDGSGRVIRKKEKIAPWPESWLSPSEERKRLIAQIRKEVTEELMVEYNRDMKKAYDAGHSDAIHHIYDFDSYIPGTERINNDCKGIYTWIIMVWVIFIAIAYGMLGGMNDEWVWDSLKFFSSIITEINASFR